MSILEQPAKPALKKRKIPIKMILLTVLVVAVILTLRGAQNYLHEKYNIGRDELNLAKIILGMATLFLWGIWWFFLSGFSWKSRIISGLVLFGLFVFASRTIRIVPSGDVNARRIEFVFWDRDLPTMNEASVVNLDETSDFDFPEFRGVGRTGVVANIKLDSWKDGEPEQVWKQPIGKGWSGFAAVNGYAVTMEQREQYECVTCYEIKTGELKWIHRVKQRHEDMMGLGGAGPRSTPTISQGNVYVQGATGLLQCLNGTSGELIWDVDIAELVGARKIVKTDISGLEYAYEDNSLAWGRSASPLVYEDKVIVPGGGPAGGPFVTLFAFDKNDGHEVWRGGSHMIGYGSPSVGTLLGQVQILLVGENRVTGHDPTTGVVLWEHIRPGESSADANCSQVTVVAENQILLTKGYRAGGELVEISLDDNAKFETKRKWKNPRVLTTKFNSPVLRDGFAYSLSAGYLECVKVETGEQQWIRPDRKVKEQQERFDHGQLLLVGDKLVVMSEQGVLFLIAADPAEYRELGRIQALAGVCWNNLCLFGEYLLVRSELEAGCFRLPIDAAPSLAEQELAEQAGQEASDGGTGTGTHD